MKVTLQVSTLFPCVCLGYFLDLYTEKAYFQFIPQLDLIFLSIIIISIVVVVVGVVVVIIVVT